MSVEEINIIDLVSLTKTGEVFLTISDHLPWDKDNKHLLLLQDKINSYLRFIESGQIFETYPKAKDKPIIINIVMQFEPSGDVPLFLNRCKESIREAGYDLNWVKKNFNESSTNA